MSRRRAVRWLGVAGLLVLQVPLIASRANAGQVSLSVRISRVVQIENPDTGSDGDYFTKVKIGSNGFESSPQQTGTDLRPNWTFTKSVDDTAATIVQIELWDYDSGLNGGDDFMDVNPTDQAVSLTFTVDPVTRTWTSPDLPANAVQSRGDGDHGFPAANDGRISQLEFDFSFNGGADIDGDGIPDAVERFGVRNLDGTFVPGGNLAALGADPCRKSVAMQIDYMTGAADGHSHQPKAAAIAEVVAAFNAAPTAAVVPCPYAGNHQPTGLDFVSIPGKAIPEAPVMGFDASYRNARNANFPAGLGPYAHYAVFVHDQAAGTSSSGLCCDDQRGNKDIIVSLGSWRTTCVGAGTDTVLNTAASGDDVVSGTSILVGNNRNCESTATGDDSQNTAVGAGAANAEVGTVRDQSGSIMHELGHALGLGHGGVDKTNFKPNYLSVMNYSFDPGGVPLAAGASRLDYSRSALATLSKTSLSEPAGITDGTDFTTWLDAAGKSQNGRGNAALDWDGDGAIDASNVNVNINSNDDDAAKNDPLVGFDDWSNLKFRAVDSPTASGASASTHGPDITFSAVLSRELNLQQYFSPDLAAAKTVDKADATPGDTLGYTVTVTNVGTGPATSVSASDTLPNATVQTSNLTDAAPGNVQTLHPSYLVPCTTPDGAVLVNNVTVAGRDAAGGPETKTTNNSASAQTAIHAAVLSITKTATSPVLAGEAITYTITVSNTGTGAASTVTVNDLLAAEVYYSKALDLGTGPQPDTVTPNADGTTRLSWNLGALAGGASRTIVYTARPSLLLRAGDSKANSATASAVNSNGCTVAPVTTATTTSISQVAPTRNPLSHGYWTTHTESRTDELRARVQATDQRFDGADGTSPQGALSNPEADAVLNGGGGQPTVLRFQLLATFFDLANRSINASTRIRSATSLRLGIVDVGQAVRYAEATLALDPNTNKSRYSDATTLLDEIVNNKSEQY